MLFRSSSIMISDEPFTSVESTAISLQAEAVRAIAKKTSCVIVGRRADKILKGQAKVLSIFVTAPLEERVKRVVERECVNEKEAREMILQADKKRAEYYNSLYDEGWGVASNYTLCLDTSVVGVEGSAEIVARVAKK